MSVRRPEPLMSQNSTPLVSVDALKSASRDLPSGDQRELIEKKIKQAEDIMARADAMLAKDLGMLLCDCTWPPQIMRRRGHAHVCPVCQRHLEGSSSGRAQSDYDVFTGDWMTS